MESPEVHFEVPAIASMPPMPQTDPDPSQGRAAIAIGIGIGNMVGTRAGSHGVRIKAVGAIVVVDHAGATVYAQVA